MLPVKSYLLDSFALNPALRRLYVRFKLGSRTHRIPALNGVVPSPTPGQAAAWSTLYPLADRRLMADGCFNCAAVGWSRDTGFRVVGHTDELGPRVNAVGAGERLLARLSSRCHPTRGPYGAASPFFVLSRSGLSSLARGAVGEVLLHTVDMPMVPIASLNAPEVNREWRDNPAYCTTAATNAVELVQAQTCAGLTTLTYSCYDDANASLELVRNGTLILYTGPSGASVRWRRDGSASIFEPDVYPADNSAWVAATSAGNTIRLMPKSVADELTALGAPPATMIKRWGVGTHNLAMWDTGIRLLMALTLPPWATEITLEDASSVPIDDWLLEGRRWMSRRTRVTPTRDVLLRAPSYMLGRTLRNLLNRQDGGGPAPDDPAIRQAVVDMQTSATTYVSQHSGRIRYAESTARHSGLSQLPSSHVLIPPTVLRAALTRADFDRTWPGRRIGHFLGAAQEGPVGGDGELILQDGQIRVIAPGLPGEVTLTLANAEATMTAIGAETLYTTAELADVGPVLEALGIPELGNNVMNRPKQAGESSFQMLAPTIYEAPRDDFIEAVVAFKVLESPELLRCVIGLRDAEVALIREVHRVEPTLPSSGCFLAEDGSTT